jgi:hypothetical protein
MRKTMAAIATAATITTCTIPSAGVAYDEFHRGLHHGLAGQRPKGAVWVGLYGASPAPNFGFDLKDLDRYYDRSLYLDSCFVDRGLWTPFGLAVTQFNTCYH